MSERARLLEASRGSGKVGREDGERMLTSEEELGNASRWRWVMGIAIELLWARSLGEVAPPIRLFPAHLRGSHLWSHISPLSSVDGQN